MCPRTASDSPSCETFSCSTRISRSWSATPDSSPRESPTRRTSLPCALSRPSNGNAPMKFQRSTHHPRVTAGLLALLFALALLPTAPRSVTAQQVAGGDFDICDYCGSLVANTMHLRGRPGFGTNLGQFVLINAANDAQDVDRDGWASGVNFTNLFVQQVSDFINAAQPSNTIGASNFVLAEFLNPLNNGFQNVVSVSVNVPIGTAAGTYRGRVV